jgi:hypothetical protein
MSESKNGSVTGGTLSAQQSLCLMWLMNALILLNSDIAVNEPGLIVVKAASLTQLPVTTPSIFRLLS